MATAYPDKNSAKSGSKKQKGAKKGAKKGKGAAKGAAPDEPVLSRKEQKIKEREEAKARSTLIQFTGTAFGICGFLGAIVALLVEPTLGIALTAALLCLILSFKYQRQAMYAFLIYIPFSGTVVYALGGNSLLQLAKDAFYIPALIGVIQFCRSKKLPIIMPKALALPVGLLATCALMTFLFANLPQQIQASGSDKPMAMGILGFKVLLGYFPIITCIYYSMRTKEDLYLLLRIQVTLVIVACGLGLVQYVMLSTGICKGTQATGVDLFKASLDSRCFVGGSLLYSPEHGQIRLPGTFVAPWQWGWFLIASAFFGFGTTFNDRSPFWRLMGIISLVAVFVMSVLSGQRIALVLVPAVIVILCILTGQIVNLKRFLPIGVVLGFILVILMIRNPEVVNERVTSFQARWAASPPHAFVMQQFAEVNHNREGLLGNGLGRATNAARAFGNIQLIETYHPKLMFEIGPIGLIATLILYTVLTVETFKAYRSTKDKNLRGYAASMWVFVLFISYFPYYYPLDVDPVAVYYWLAAGIALKIPKLDQQERDLAAIASGQANEKQLKRAQKMKNAAY
jgi:hypothetical protein